MIGSSDRVGTRWTAALVVLMAVVAACGDDDTDAGSAGGATTTVAGGQPAPEEGNTDPIRVAFMLPLTGPFAANGLNQQNGFELGLDTFGREVDGHPIEVRYVDTKGDPATALTSARKVVQDGVDIVQGPLVASEAQAVVPFFAAEKVPVDELGLCSEIQLDSWQKNGNAYGSGLACGTGDMMAAKWAYEEKGWRNVTLAGMDYSFGWAASGAFKAAFEELGGTVNKEIWVPLNATDVSSYVSQIPPDTDGVHAVMAGVFASRFTDAYRDFGLTGKVPLIGPTQLTDMSALPAMNPAAATGVLTGGHYCDGIDTPENKEFVDAYHERFDLFPGYYSDAGYVKAQVLVEAMKSLGGDASDKEAVAQALQSVAIKAPRGPVTIDERTKSPIQNIYICEVQMLDGALRNVPIATFENVPPNGPREYEAWEEDFRHDSKSRPE